MAEDRTSKLPRRTPYEVVFVDGGLQADALPAIAEEAEARGVDAAEPERLVMLGESAKTMRRMRPDDVDATPGRAVAEYGALLFHGFHFWRAGHPFFVIDEATMRALLERPPRVGDWTLSTPAPAGYVQLPRHRVWIPSADAGPPEPVDGFFWTTTPVASVAGAPPSTVLHLALVLGMRPDRPGFTVAEISAPVPQGPTAHWADLSAREGGADFENVLPGGEIGGLFALTSVAEALRLASLILWAASGDRAGLPVDRARPADDRAGSPDDAAGTPDPSHEPVDAVESAGTSAHASPPTELAYRRITLRGIDG
jgi:hypothetical protein